VKIYERGRAIVASFYDKPTGSFQYVLVDKATRSAVIIDPVLDFDEKAAATRTKNADKIAAYVQQEGLHPPASAGRSLRSRSSGKIFTV
jgi:glyoxylase-like metal-dependent hydrolase (beta-lactamase superfamily II)